MTSLRRFIVLFLLSFTFGGFFFYAGVVVPIGTSVLGSTTQGFVTRLVTKTLNAATVVTLLAVAGDAIIERTYRSRGENRVLMTCICLIAVCCVTLFWLHAKLDALLDPEGMVVNDSDIFYGMHRVYLWTSTLQWVCSLPVLWIVVNSPRLEHRQPRASDVATEVQ